MWICCWSWISTVHQSVMFFTYMQRSTDLEAYISSCKFWSCLFTFYNANTFFFFLSVSAQTSPKTSTKSPKPSLIISYPILVMWQIQIVNPSQLGDVFFFTHFWWRFSQGMTWNSPCAAWWTWSRLPALTNPLLWPGRPMPGWSLTAPSGGGHGTETVGSVVTVGYTVYFCVYTVYRIA